MTTQNGTPESITKSWKSGGRVFQGYVVRVSIAGVDMYEVGLSALRRCLGLHKLEPKHTLVLSLNKPQEITFTGNDHYASNDYQITDASAEDWANRVKGLI